MSHQPGGVIGREAQQHEVPFSWDVAHGPIVDGLVRENDATIK